MTSPPPHHACPRPPRLSNINPPSLPFFVLLFLLPCLLPPPKCTLPSMLLHRLPTTSSHPVSALPTFQTHPLNTSITSHLACPHIVLLSAARHGSTWLIDSADNCRYSNHLSASAHIEKRQGKYSWDVYSHSELWSNNHPGPLSNISPTSAAAYVRRNASVKIFPHTTDRPSLVRHFFLAAKELNLPVAVLRRNVADSWQSLKEAKRFGNWAAIRRTHRRGTVNATGEDDDAWPLYEKEMEEYFEFVVALLRETGVRFDVFWYEHIVNERRIWLGNAGCYVRNCNFER